MKMIPTITKRIAGAARTFSMQKGSLSLSSGNCISGCLQNYFYNNISTPTSMTSIDTNRSTRPFSSRTRPSRRRRGGAANPQPKDNGAQMSDEDRSSVNKPTDTIQDPAVFQYNAKAFLDRVEIALEPMKQHNDVFKIIRSDSKEGMEMETLKIALKPGEGQYLFTIDEDMRTITMVSPMSGSYNYVLCAYTGQFVGMEDGHLCEGMLVRDLIRHCNGLPQF